MDDRRDGFRKSVGLPWFPVVTASPSSAGGVGLSAGSQGAMIPHSSWPKNQHIKQKFFFFSYIVRSSIKTLKIVYIKKNL